MYIHLDWHMIGSVNLRFKSVDRGLLECRNGEDEKGKLIRGFGRLWMDESKMVEEIYI